MRFYRKEALVNMRPNRRKTGFGCRPAMPRRRYGGGWWLVMALGFLAMAVPAGADSFQAEVVIGDRLAAAGFQRYGMPIENDEIQSYVNKVGAAVTRNAAEPDTPFYFVVLDNDRIIASWSCPGGIVALTTGFLRVMENEAELAGVLAHEAAHVTGRHPLRSYGRADFEGSADTLAELIKRLATVVFRQGISPSLEYAADDRSLETVYRTGYDPGAFVHLLKRLQEVSDAARLSGSWFRTHPDTALRIERCRTRLADFRDRAELATVPRRFAEIMGRLD